MAVVLSDELRAFLDQPLTFARIATVDIRQAPQVTTMWFRRAGDSLRMVCEPHAAKARNVRHNSRVAVVVEHPDDPYRYYQLRGTASVDDDPAVAREETRLLAQRYLGAERAAVYLATIGDDPLVTIVLEVERVTSFVGANASSESRP